MVLQLHPVVPEAQDVPKEVEDEVRSGDRVVEVSDGAAQVEWAPCPRSPGYQSLVDRQPVLRYHVKFGGQVGKAS